MRASASVLPLFVWFLVAAALGSLIAGLRAMVAGQIPETLVIAITIALLDLYPIYLDPTGEIPLTPVITVGAVVLFGWAPTIVGAAVGTLFGLFRHPAREVVVNGSIRLGALIAAAGLASVAPAMGSNRDVSAVIAVLYAGAGYWAASVFLSAARLCTEDAVTWQRAVRFQLAATTFHLAVFTLAAAVAVWVISNDPSRIDLLLVPPLAATLVLQLYLPRILRGEQQRRALSSVSVLAAAVDAKDPYTANHSAAVAELSRRVARVLDLDEPDVHRVYLTGLLHDVGKTVVPPEILLKTGKLTEEEWQVMRSHVEAGVRIVQSIGGLAEIAPFVGASHERLDGAGYPAGLAGEAIPLSSRINLVVDAYNALTTNRPYRPARSPEAALRELEAHRGTQFDPRVVTAIRAALGLSRALPPQRNAPDPRVVATLRTALGLARAPETREDAPNALTLFRQPAFALLWIGQLVSFLGDEIFFIALSLWVYRLTGSATILAVALIAATVGQGLLGLLAGALADRMDRRGVMITADLGRAVLVGMLPFVILRSLPLGFLVLVVLSVGTVFFRAAVYGLIPSIVTRALLPSGNALLQTTERVAEIVGGVLGGVIVLTLGYVAVFYLDALSFLVSAVCIGLMPVAWRAGLATTGPKHIATDIKEGLDYIRHTPLHWALALLIIPGYLTLAFTGLRAPMIIKAAALPAVAYGVVNSVIGVGKLVSALSLAAIPRGWSNVSFVVGSFLLTALGILLFGATTSYSVLLMGAFLFGAGNIASNIANASISLSNTPSGIVGRLMSSRQVFIAGTTLVGMLIFGRLADVAGPPFALVMLGAVSAGGVLIVWFTIGRRVAPPTSQDVPRSVTVPSQRNA